MVGRKPKKRRRPSPSQGKSERTINLNFRVLNEEKHIIDRMTANLVAKNPHLNRSDIIKELMGMTRSGFISEELKNQFFEECERARKEERERDEARRKVKLPTADNDKSGYIHSPDRPATAYNLPSGAPLTLVKKFDEEDILEPFTQSGD
jgi:hypothetical protein